jgi:hypothetical protein
MWIILMHKKIHPQSKTYVLQYLLNVTLNYVLFILKTCEITQTTSEKF